MSEKPRCLGVARALIKRGNERRWKPVERVKSFGKAADCWLLFGTV